MQKNQLNSLIYSWDIADFRVPEPKRSQPYLTMYIPKVTFTFTDTMYQHVKSHNQNTSDHNHSNIFLWTLNFWNQHVKKATSALCLRDIFDLKS